jgi:hypothetical protein
MDSGWREGGREGGREGETDRERERRERERASKLRPLMGVKGGEMSEEGEAGDSRYIPDTGHPLISLPQIPPYSPGTVYRCC